MNKIRTILLALNESETACPCATFKFEQTEEELEQESQDFVYFRRSAEEVCWSSAIGRVGGRQVRKTRGLSGIAHENFFAIQSLY